jgi:phosphate transport system permease protein
VSARLDGYVSRRTADRAATVVSGLAVALAVLPFVAILAYVTSRGAAALSVSLFTELPESGTGCGGLANAVIGTLELVGLAILMGVPVGVLAGLFLAEYRATLLARTARFCADVLAGVPSILVGIVVYATVVVGMRSFSGLAGSLALAIMMLPLVARTTDALARTVPDALREAAIALGAPRWRIAIHVVLRTAAPGIRAGTMLAVARVCGETAPLLFTAFDNDFWARTPLEPTSSMQVRVFFYTLSAQGDRHAQAWAASLVLVALVMLLHVAARRLDGSRKRSRT